MAQGKKTFSGFEISALLGVAALFDVISAVPVVNVVSGIIAWTLFGFIFYMKGVSLTKHPQLLGKSIAALIVGLIPVLSVLPEFTLVMFLNMRSINKKDMKEMKTEETTGVSRITRM